MLSFKVLLIQDVATTTESLPISTGLSTVTIVSYRVPFAQTNNLSLVEPESWGYLPRGDNPSFVEDTSLNVPPFKLHLVGSGYINVPTEIKNIIVFHTGLNYSDFYSLMSTMDACVPAFMSEDDHNFRIQDSSSIAMCMETNVSPFLPTSYFNVCTYLFRRSQYWQYMNYGSLIGILTTTG